MGQIIQNFTTWIQDFVVSNNVLISIIVGCSIVILESIIPFLPLAVFIAINVIAFGSLFGFVVSYISTIIGCTISFYLVKYFRKYNKSKRINSLITKFENLSFSNLVIITAIPFTPAFSINIAAGLSKIEYRKFLFILLISKLSIIYFWGFIGTTLLESITDIAIVIRIFVILLVTFVLSKIVMNYFDIS